MRDEIIARGRVSSPRSPKEAAVADGVYSSPTEPARGSVAASNRLVEIALSGEDAPALRAIEALNSRVLGRPKELVETVQKREELQRFRGHDGRGVL